MKEFKTLGPNRRDFLRMGALSLAGLTLRSRGLLGALTLGTGVEVNRSFSDVLDYETQAVIAEKALSFIRPTPEGAAELENQLRNTKYSSGDNICGTLAINQLMDATTYGFDPNVDPYNFWQANARLVGHGGGDNFLIAFPSDRFDVIKNTTPIANFDFGSVNLQPGDFIYFFAHGHGEDHMITISRRDGNGVLWAVTNYPNQDKKYIVEEVPVWNPKNPAASFVKELARGENSVGFSSGQGGFMLWRLKAGEPSAYDMFDHSPEAESLQANVESLAKNAQGEWHVMIADVEGKILAQHLGREPRHSASVIKVPIAMCLMSYLESKTRSWQNLQNFLTNNYLKTRSFDELFRAMLVDSEEDATGLLAGYLIDRHINAHDMLVSWGIKNTDPSNNRRSTEGDMWKIFTNLYDLNNTTALKFVASHKYLLDLMSIYTPNDDTRLGTLKNDGVGVIKIEDKRGSVAENNFVVVADAGIVEVVGKDGVVTPYFMSLTGSPRFGNLVDYDTLEKELLLFVDAFAGYLGKTSKVGNIFRV